MNWEKAVARLFGLWVLLRLISGQLKSLVPTEKSVDSGNLRVATVVTLEVPRE
jgi:hypothetical protein